MKYYYNNEFEDIDTENKAYILGLFYSDGFVIYNEKNIIIFQELN